MNNDQILSYVESDLSTSRVRMSSISRRFGTRKLTTPAGTLKLRLFNRLRRGRRSTAVHEELHQRGACLPRVLMTREHAGWLFKYVEWFEGLPVETCDDLYRFGESLAQLANLGAANDDYKKANLLVLQDRRVVNIDCEGLRLYDNPDARVHYCLGRQKWLRRDGRMSHVLHGYAAVRHRARGRDTM